MRIALFVNPGAGRGRGASLARELADAVSGAGHELVRLDPDPDLGTGPPDEHRLDDADVAVVVGGDGTIHHLLPELLRTGVPLYHAPAGTENLIAREFGMRAEPDALLAALASGDRRAVDTADCNGRPFVLMASVGFDAAVIDRLHAARRGAISHRTYALPIAIEVLRHRPAPLSIIADGRTVVEDTPGLAVVANCRQYGFRFNPAPKADMTDGLLDVVVLPYRRRRGLAAWAIRARHATHLRHPRAVHVLARTVTIRASDDGAAYQLDGEPAGRLERDGDANLKVAVHPSTLRVLVPPAD